MPNNKDERRKYTYVPEGYEGRYEIWKAGQEFDEKLRKKIHREWEETKEEWAKGNILSKTEKFKQELREDKEKKEGKEKRKDIDNVFENINKYLTMKHLMLDKNKVSFKYLSNENKIYISYCDNNGENVVIRTTKEGLKQLLEGEEIENEETIIIRNEGKEDSER